MLVVAFGQRVVDTLQIGRSLAKHKLTRIAGRNKTGLDATGPIRS